MGESARVGLRGRLVTVVGAVLLAGGLAALALPVSLGDYDRFGIQITCGNAYHGHLIQQTVDDQDDQCRTALAQRRAWAIPATGLGALMLIPATAAWLRGKTESPGSRQSIGASLLAAMGALSGLMVLGLVAGAGGGDVTATRGLVTPVATSEADPVPVDDPDTNAELGKLDTLLIKGRAPKTGYDRELFGPAWSDDVTVADGHNGCDTRNDILRRDLVDIETKPGTDGCVVLSGILNDPYTGTTVDFQRGRSTSREVQIDHIVALLDAWQKGAQQWDEVTARNFANDPLNLQATEGWINEQKEAGDAATWLPPNKSYRCTYVSRIVDVKAAYGLWVTQAEHDAIVRVLTAGCAG